MAAFAALHFADYLVIVALLLIPLAIGVFFAVKDYKTATRDGYLLGGRRLDVVPVALSLFVSYMSAISMMGTPADIYTHGSMYITTHLGWAVTALLTSFTTVPLFYPLHLTSIYEYLELRFRSKAVRMMGVSMGMLQTVSYMAIALLTPSLALQTMAKLELWTSIVIIGIIGTVYTAIGGIKSVVWADVFQFTVMALGLSSITFAASVNVGGLGSLWSIAESGGRTAFTEFNLDPRTRHTWWGTVVGGILYWQTNIFNQSTLQRLSSVKTMRFAKLIFIVNAFVILFYGCLVLFTGLSVYAYFAYIHCDPLQAGIVKNRNQIVPYYVLQSMKAYPGMAGLYLGALFSGSLSSISSGLNALAANTVEDFLKKPLQRVSERAATQVTMLCVGVYGLLIIGLAYLASSLEGNITQIVASLIGAFGSPALGAFILGALVPWGNKYGAMSGGSVALVVTIWMSIGNQLVGKKEKPLPLPSTEMCFGETSLNRTTTKNVYFTSKPANSVNTTEASNAQSEYGNFFLYDISYLWYASVGILICLSVGTAVSFVTRRRVQNTEDMFLFPFVRTLSRKMKRADVKSEAPEVLHLAESKEYA